MAWSGREIRSSRAKHQIRSSRLCRRAVIGGFVGAHWLRVQDAGALASAAEVPTPQDQADDADADEPLAHPCPYCGGRMIIIEIFARGCSPRYLPTGPTTAIKIDTS